MKTFIQPATFVFAAAIAGAGVAGCSSNDLDPKSARELPVDVVVCDTKGRPTLAKWQSVTVKEVSLFGREEAYQDGRSGQIAYGRNGRVVRLSSHRPAEGEFVLEIEPILGSDLPMQDWTCLWLMFEESRDSLKLVRVGVQWIVDLPHADKWLGLQQGSIEVDSSRRARDGVVAVAFRLSGVTTSKGMCRVSDAPMTIRGCCTWHGSSDEVRDLFALKEFVRATVEE